LRTFLISIFLLINIVLFSQQKIELYSSNSNGLSLRKINTTERKKYKYVLEVYLDNNKIQRKILYKDNSENKRWSFQYTAGILSKEYYYKEGLLAEEYFFDSDGHKIKQIEYKNSKPLKTSTYLYNKEGMVEIENSINELNNQETITKFKYDSNFRIKQIQKKYPDTRIVYWEAFFSPKGIIVEEHYSFNEQKYTFWYNENGQETRGELKDYSDINNPSIIKEWNTTYTKNGKIDKKEELNYNTGKKILTWYNQNLKENKIETYIKDKIVSIEKFDYNKKNKVISYELIEGLNSTKIYYEYDDKDNITKETNYQNDKLKKITNYNLDKSRIEIIYGENNKIIYIEYDKDGKFVSEKQIE
jgi:antitoxin component YwqK of YwqJK toxin-antitoxin module